MPREEKNTIDASATTVADSKTAEQEGLPEKQLEDTTAARLQDVFDGKGVPEDVVETETETETETEAKPDESEESTPDPDKGEEASTDEEGDTTLESESKAGEEKEGTEIETEATDAEAGKDAKEVTPLPDIYYRAAIHRGMKPEEITEFYNTNPEVCVRTLSGIYEAVKRSNAEFAAQGRSRKERMEQAAQAAAAPQKEESEFVDVDIAALEESEMDPDALAVIKTLNDQNKQLYDKIQSVESTVVQPQESLDRATAQEVNLIDQQITNFFKSEEAKPYTDLYGTIVDGATDWSGLLPGEKANRWAVIEMMDDIIAGAELNNRDISVDEAMRMAHLNVSEPQRTKVIREELKATVVKRNKSLSLKPSGASKSDTSSSSGPKSEEDLETDTQARLNKVFG